MDCPINAQPPMPPVSPAARFPIPWPTTSFLVEPLFPSSTIPSSSCSVSKLSIEPTAAMVIAYGKIIFTVFNGALISGAQKDEGNPNLGKIANPPRNVSLPATSAKVLTGQAKYFAAMADNITPPKVGGMAFAASIFSCNLGIPNLTSAIVNNAHP
mmetsp:Transcript_11531/g.22314  ORF Transcript_11531/g.22314 Transcript_11531/m.22314 type:complete len:156 (+) Transcript_11531:811-1278(+)